MWALTWAKLVRTAGVAGLLNAVPGRRCGSAVIQWAGTAVGQLPRGDQRLGRPRPSSLVWTYCATTRLDLADCGPDPALFLAWTVNR